VLAAGLMFFLSSFTRHEMALTILFLLLGSGFLFAYLPTFWAIPTTMPERGSGGRQLWTHQFHRALGGFTGNYAIGFLNDPNALANSQFRVHSARLFCGGSLDP